MRRRKLYSDWEKFNFTEISFGEAVPLKEINTKLKISSDVVNGTPASSGVTTARACVLDNIGEIDQLQKGFCYKFSHT